MTGEYLTMAEIEAKYPNEWVLIGWPKNDAESGEVIGGVVIWHDADRATFEARLQHPSYDMGNVTKQYTGHLGDPNFLLYIL